MNENNLNTNVGLNPNQQMQPNMGMNMNPSQPMQPNMGMNMNPSQPMQPNMGMNMNPSQPMQPNVGMNMNQANYSSPGGTNKPKNNIGIIIGVSVAAIVIVLVVVIFFLSGGNKKLICSQSQSLGMGISMDAVATINFKGKTIDNAILNMEVDLGSYASFKDTFIEQFEEEYKTYEEKGIKLEITSDSSKVYMRLDVNKNQIKDADITTYNTYDEVKSDLESQGFICE